MNRFESAVKVLRRGLPISGDSPWMRPLAPAYTWLLDSLYGRRGLTRCLNGEMVRVRPAFRALREDREPMVFHTLRRLVTPGSTVLDVGASFGEFAIVLARWCGPGGRVVAFEPTPVTRAALMDHLELNGLRDRVDVVDAAVSDYVGSGTLHAIGRSGENTLNASYFGGEAEPLPVSVTTIDAYCERHGLTPAAIKLDVEGLEIHALRGARRTLARTRAAIVVELHPGSWQGVGESGASAERIVRELEYRVVPLEGQSRMSDGGHVLLEPAA